MDDANGLFLAGAKAVDLDLKSAKPINGGSINSAWKLAFSDGSTAFLKSRPEAPEDEFPIEAAGLEWLGSADGLDVPEVLAVIAEPRPGLLLEWIETGDRSGSDFDRQLGRGLARIHSERVKAFGALPPGAGTNEFRVGPVAMPARAEPDRGQGFAGFYAARLEGLVAQACDRGAIEARDVPVFVTLSQHIEQIAGEPEPAVLTHGDLWSGNVLVPVEGRPCLIDPAAHGAHRELDLAMLALFGSPSPDFYRAYEDVLPLKPGWRERFRLWMIQPLLIHAILFKGSYGPRAVDTARSFV